MSQLALYRKYRSQTFGDLIGQDHVVKTLQNAIDQGKFSHAYLFTGPRGTGKTSTARLLAKALNCESGPAKEPCNECASCLSITQGNSMDVLELDAASESGVEDVRESIVEASEYQPSSSRFRVFIIDEVHDLSGKAFDALLKTVEEPPEHVIFILATTEYNKVPPTIRSRCQRFEFHRGSIADVSSRLQHVIENEGVKADPAALNAIARMSDGGFRDALTLLDQAILTAEGDVTLDHVYNQLGLITDEAADGILVGMSEGDVERIIKNLDEIYRSGRDPRSILESLLMRLSDLTRALYGLEIGASTDSAVEASLRSTSTKLGEEKILRFRSMVSEAHRFVRDVSLPRIWVEAELIRIATYDSAKAAPAQAVVQQKPSLMQKAERPAPKPQPQPAPEPKPEPTPQPKPEAKPEPEPEQKPPPKQESEPAAAAETQPVAVSGEEALVAAWKKVVDEISNLSKAASVRFAHSKFAGVSGKSVLISFDRQVNADWVNNSDKVTGKVYELWRANGGEEYALKFVANDVPEKKAVEVEQTAVVLPAEGERLEELGREVFGTES